MPPKRKASSANGNASKKRSSRKGGKAADAVEGDVPEVVEDRDEAMADTGEVSEAPEAPEAPEASEAPVASEATVESSVKDENQSDSVDQVAAETVVAGEAASDAVDEAAGNSAVSKDAAEDSKETSSKTCTIQFLVPTSIGEAVEDPQRGILNKLKTETGVSVEVGEKIRGASERIIISGPGSPKVLGKIASELIQFKYKIEFSGKKETAKPSQFVIRAIVPEAIISEGYLEAKSSTDHAEGSLEISRSQLPFSTDRLVTLRGDLQQIQQLVIDVSQVLAEHSDSLDIYPPVPYTPRVVTGIYGHPETFRRQLLNESLASVNPYIVPIDHSANTAATGAIAAVAVPEASVSTPITASKGELIIPADDSEIVHLVSHNSLNQAQQQARSVVPGQPIIQKVYIPREMVGAIIGKGGTKINELRQMSGANVKIIEAGPNDSSTADRMVTLAGTPESNQMALHLLYQRIETERHHHKKI